MYPYGWSAGETPVEPRDTFVKFQAFSDAAREFAALHVQGKTYNEVFESLAMEHNAANDNRSVAGDEAISIMLSKPYTNMLICWLNCGRDMLLTKLTYVNEENYELDA